VNGFANRSETIENSRIEMGGGLQNHFSNIKGLAQKRIGYRYTIPQ